MILVIWTVAALTAQAQVQHWYYDFGTARDSCTQGVSTTLLPAPPAGTPRVRIGTQGGGVYLLPSAPSVGNGSACCLRAPTGASLNKVQLFDFPAAASFTLRCRMRIDSMPGDLYLFAGNGSCFSDNGGFTSAEVFTGLRWSVDSTRTVTLAVRGPSGWTSIGGNVMQGGQAFTLELYCNNGATTRSYMHDSVQSVAARSSDIWINDLRIADDVVKTGLPDSLGIDSFMWYTAQSPANALSVHLDDVRYFNNIAAVPLPVEGQVFHAYRDDTGVRLTWSTVTELQNYGFSVERRRIADSLWTDLHFIPGAGNSSIPRHYSWTDSSARRDHGYVYRLRQQDRDGGISFSSPQRVMPVNPAGDAAVDAPWPLPANTMLHLPVILTRPSRIRLRILTLTGETVAELTGERLLPAGRHVLPLPCAAWPRGMLLVALHTRERSLLSPIFLR